jgi:hypothetical protein
MRLTALIIGFLVIAAGVGCQKDEALPPHQGSQSSTSTIVAESGTITPVGATPSATQPTSTAPPVGSTPAGGRAVIATTDAERPGVTLNVTELKRGSGDTVMLRFNIVNNGTGDFDFGYDLSDPGVGGGDYGSIGGVHLIDPVGKKKYYVVRDADAKCVCSRGVESVKPGDQRTLWAKFPSPPADVQRVTLVVPKFIPVDDVPIS